VLKYYQIDVMMRRHRAKDIFRDAKQAAVQHRFGTEQPLFLLE
jgi:hypothetical protein